jgi:hypothetical protein
VGFLHGVLPQGISKSYLFRPTKVRILVTDPILLPDSIREAIETDLRIKIEVLVSKDWDESQAKLVSSPSPDLVIAPSYWAKTLQHQNLLRSPRNQESLTPLFASDFVITDDDKRIYYFPLYWMLTELQSQKDQDSFEDFAKDKKRSPLSLMKDEDLILKHFETWKNLKKLELIQQKEILTKSLEDLMKKTPRQGNGLFEAQVGTGKSLTDQPQKTLLSWGAFIPKYAAKVDLSKAIIKDLANEDFQLRYINHTPFRSALNSLSPDKVPFDKSPVSLRNIELKNVQMLEEKNIEAKRVLAQDYNFIL